MGNLAITCATPNKSFDEIKRFSSVKNKQSAFYQRPLEKQKGLRAKNGYS